MAEFTTIQFIKRSKFVIEVDELHDAIENCADFIRNGDVNGVAEAFDNSLFKRYVLENREYQVELWKALAEDEVSHAMFEVFGELIADDIRASIPIRMEDDEEEDDE
jgi:hypothetical protein